MFLNEPLLTGTIFTWYNVGILFLILYTLIIQIYEMLTLKPNEWSVVKFWKILVNKFNKKKQSSKNQEKDEYNQVSKTEN